MRFSQGFRWCSVAYPWMAWNCSSLPQDALSVLPWAALPSSSLSFPSQGTAGSSKEGSQAVAPTDCPESHPCCL